MYLSQEQSNLAKTWTIVKVIGTKPNSILSNWLKTSRRFKWIELIMGHPSLPLMASITSSAWVYIDFWETIFPSYHHYKQDRSTKGRYAIIYKKQHSKTLKLGPYTIVRTKTWIRVITNANTNLRNFRTNQHMFRKNHNSFKIYFSIHI